MSAGSIAVSGRGGKVELSFTASSGKRTFRLTPESALNLSELIVKAAGTEAQTDPMSILNDLINMATKGK